MMQVQMPKFACSHICTDCSVKRILVTAHLYCIIHPGILLLFTVRFGKLFGIWLVTAVCLYILKHHWHTTGSWKNASGVLESPGKVLEIFLTKTVGTLNCAVAYPDHAHRSWPAIAC